MKGGAQRDERSAMTAGAMGAPHQSLQCEGAGALSKRQRFALEEFHLGFWERLGHAPDGALFRSWADADRFIDRLHDIYPDRAYRIVGIDGQENQHA